MNSAYQRFIAANHALMSCYEAVPAEAFKAMDAKAQDAVCHEEKTVVYNMIKNDEVHFREVIKERIAAFQ